MKSACNNFVSPMWLLNMNYNHNTRGTGIKHQNEKFFEMFLFALWLGIVWLYALNDKVWGMGRSLFHYIRRTSFRKLHIGRVEIHVIMSPTQVDIVEI